MHDEGVSTTEPAAVGADGLAAHGDHSPHAARLRHSVTPWLNGADTFVYILVGVVFLAGALTMLGYAVITFVQNLNTPGEFGGFPQDVVTLVNDLLLVMIIMEVLRTVLSYIEEGGASLRPFLFIGAISATRRILAIGAETSLAEGKPVSREEFVRRLVDLGVNALVVLLIVIALYLLSRRQAE